MKVYLIESTLKNVSSIHHVVFSTREKAEQYLTQLPAKMSGFRIYYNILELEVR